MNLTTLFSLRVQLRACRIGTSCLVVLMLALTSGPVAAASPSLATCSPPAYDNPSPDEIATLWEKDSKYYAYVSGTKTKKKIRILGDVLVFDGKSFDSLGRTSDRARGDIEELTIDARKIVIDGPLSFTGTNLRFFAREIEWQEGGSIAFTVAPGTAKARLELDAQSIRFARESRVPFLFHTGTKDTKFTDRQFVVNTASFRLDNESSLTSQGALDFLFQRSLDAFVPGSEPDPEAWSVKVGDAGSDQFLRLLEQEMAWPRFYATKVTAFHALYAYSPSAQAFLLKSIADQRALIEGWQRQAAWIQLLGVRDNILNRRDYLGWSAEFAPRQNILSQLASLRSAFDEADQASEVKYVRNLIAFIAAGNATALNAAEFKRIDDDISKIDAALPGLAAQITEAMNGLSTTVGKRMAATAVASQYQINDEKIYNDKKKQAKDAASITALGQGIAIVASLCIAQPEIAAAVATGSVLAADLAAQHNGAGGPQTVASALATSLKTGKDIQKSAQALSASWSSAQKASADLARIDSGNKITVTYKDQDGKDVSRDMTRDEARSAKLKALSSLADAASTMYESYPKDSTSAQLSLNKIEAGDEALVALLKEINGLSADELKQNAAIQSLTTQYKQLEQDRIRKTEERILLSTSDITNDAERMRWASLASSLWTDYITRRYRQALALERSFVFQTGSRPFKPAFIGSSPEIGLVYFDSKLDGLGEDDEPAKPQDLVAKNLTEQYESFRKNTEAFYFAVKDSRSDFVKNKNPIQPSEKRFSFIAGSPDRASDRFVRELNEAFVSELQRIEKGKPQLPPRPIAMPLDFGIPATNEPEYLLGWEVIRIEFDGPSPFPNFPGGSLDIDVIHPGYGMLIRNRTNCISMDFRSANAENELVLSTSLPPFNPATGKIFTPQQVRLDLENDAFYTYWPARSFYSATLLVTGTPVLSKKLQIKRIDFKMHYLR